MTWFVGQGALNLKPRLDYRFIGIYRQVFDARGALVGKDTRAVRSINGAAGTTVKTMYDFPYDQQASFSDPTANRCVVIASGVNQVTAFAYNSVGRIQQSSRLLQYHRSFVSNYADAVGALWTAHGGLLLDSHFNHNAATGTLSVYPLR